MSSEPRPRREERVLTQRTGGDLVLLNPDNGMYFTLDEVGARIWELCDGTRTADEIAGTLEQEYEAPRNEIERDVRDLLEELGRERLVAGGGQSS